MIRLRPEWILFFLRITGMRLKDTDFLSLEETDTLTSVFAKKAKASYSTHRYWPANTPWREIDDTVVNLVEKQQLFIVFHRADAQIGALVLSAKEILNYTENLRELLGDISLMTKDGSKGLCLEKPYYDSNGDYVAEGVWELTTWGC